MKRGSILIVSLAAALLALFSISAVLAAPGRMPRLQIMEEEPNNSFDEADQNAGIPIGGNVRGTVSETDELDYFRISTEVGREYKTSLNVTGQSGGLDLKMSVFNGNRGFIDDDSSSLTWEASHDSHYILVEALLATTTTVQSAQYRVSVNVIAATPTPSETPADTATPEPVDEDDYEPNDTFAEADGEGPTLPIQVPILLELTFHNEDDDDYFRFYAKEDRWYQATTSDLNLVDTLVEIYDADQTRVGRDDDGAGGLASQASWQADYDGYYYIVVQNNVDSVGGYNLTLDEITAPATETPGPSPTPGATPRAEADDCEPNLDFEHACVIPVNETQTFDFLPVLGEGPDNDFYKIWVKSGLHFRCETSELAPGVDPNMIIFSGPSWDHAIAGNDDVEEGNYNSALNYYATYDGWLYVLVGTGDRTPPDIYDSYYDLRCEKSTESFVATSTPQPTATSGAPEETPTATPTRAESPPPTVTPGTQALSIRPVTTPTPPATPAPRFVPVSLLVYYDANDDGQIGAGEGITGISAQAYDVATDELLAQGYTDAQGSLDFTVSAQGPVRITIPFLGFSHLVTGAEASIQVRVPPRSLLGGTP